jgi:hypothetical protein
MKTRDEEEEEDDDDEAREAAKCNNLQQKGNSV